MEGQEQYRNAVLGMPEARITMLLFHTVYDRRTRIDNGAGDPFRHVHFLFASVVAALVVVIVVIDVAPKRRRRLHGSWRRSRMPVHRVAVVTVLLISLAMLFVSVAMNNYNVSIPYSPIVPTAATLHEDDVGRLRASGRRKAKNANLFWLRCNRRIFLSLSDDESVE